MTSIRVLHVIPSVALSDGGPSRAMAVFERVLSAAGMQVTTATTDHGLKTDERAVFANGANRIYARKWATTFKIAPGLAAYLWANISDFDLVHIHSLFSFAPTVAAWIARMKGVPYIVRPLGTLAAYGVTSRRPRLKSLFLRLNEGPIIRHAAAVHFTSDIEMEEAQSLDLAMRGVVIPLGIEGISRNAGPDLREQFPLLANRKIILFLSRLDPKKNVEALIDAFAGSEVLQRTSALAIAGDGSESYVNELKGRAEALGIGASVFWLGHVDGETKVAVLRAADVFVLPSYSENFGIAAAEAMLAGLPCVLSPGVAIADQAALAGAAVIAEPNGGDIARKLCEITNDAEQRLSMARRAQIFASDNYSSTKMAARLVDLYAGVIAEYKRRSA
jgi:glycosyltransferase involved in cell wall biosynthesis